MNRASSRHPPEHQEDLVTVTTMRGVAALGVCWFHIALWNEHLPEWSFSFGIHGPLVFFIISGFVVPWALWRAQYRLASGLRFLARRLVRLEPPYFATITMVLCLEYVRSRVGWDTEQFSIEWGRLAAHLGYVNAFVGWPWYNPVFWTLAIEFQYYLVVGLIFPLLLQRDWRIRTLLMLGLLGLYLPLHGTGESSWLLRFLPPFMNGFLLFQRRAGIVPTREFWLWSLVLVAVCTGYSRLMPFLALVTIWLLLENRFQTTVTNFLGQISYSLYLIHVPVGRSIQDVLLKEATSDALAGTIAVVTTGVCVVAAWGFFRFVEQPSMRLARRIRYGVRRPALVRTETSSASDVASGFTAGTIHEKLAPLSPFSPDPEAGHPPASGPGGRMAPERPG